MVLEFCSWEVERSAPAFRMQTNQAFQGFALALERSLSLTHRTLRLATQLKNTGKAFIPVRWFPQPFYP